MRPRPWCSFLWPETRCFLPGLFPRLPLVEEGFLVLLPALIVARAVVAFPSYASLASLSERELDAIIPTLEFRISESPPGPFNDTSTKLVNNAETGHPGALSWSQHFGISWSLYKSSFADFIFIVTPQKWYRNSSADCRCDLGR